MQTDIKVPVKRLHKDAVIPSYAHSGDGGMDLTSISVNRTGSFIEHGTGLAVAIPRGYVGLLFPRSSISKKDLSLANAVGIIDQSFRGEIKLRFKNAIVFSELEIEELGNEILDQGYDEYNVGDKIGQIMIIPRPEVMFEEVDDLSDTERGGGGFGSTGN